ncbi:MAG: ribonuclease T [Pseudomonadota bacterium]
MLSGELRRRGWGRGPILIALAALAVILSLVFQNGPRFSGQLERMLAPEAGVENAAASGGVSPAAAQSGLPVAPGDFDYYLLALSWSPSYCRTRPDADQCGQGRGFIVHGLWPQNERDWPSDCATAFDRPTTGLLRRYEGLSGGRGLLAHQWRKHGSCTGLSPGDYFATMAAALERVRIPDGFARVDRDLTTSARAVEQDFVRANPAFGADGVTVKCGDGRLREVRLCFDKSLSPRACGPAAVRDCRAAEIEAPAPK